MSVILKKMLLISLLSFCYLQACGHTSISGDVDATGDSVPDTEIEEDGELEIPPECGNGTIEAGEECDDGNEDDWDGCNSCLIGEILINNNTESQQTTSVVSVNQDGSFIVVWSGSTPHDDYFGISGRQFGTTGQPEGNDFLINNYTNSIQSNPSIGVNAVGQFVVAWDSNIQDGDGFGVYGQHFTEDAIDVGSEFRLNTYTVGNQGNISISMSGYGDYIAVWASEGQDGDSSGIFGQLYNDSGVPVGSEFRINSHIDGEQVDPSVAMSSDGRFVVVWESRDQDGDGFGIFGQRFELSGAYVGEEFQVNQITDGHQRSPDVAINESGNFIVVWEDQAYVDSAQEISAQLYSDSGLRIGAQFKVNADTDRFLQVPYVAIKTDGGFIIVWCSKTDTTMCDIYCSRFDETGSSIGSEFIVQQFTISNGMPSLDMLGDGRFTVVWPSRLLDEEGDIFAQRFAADGNPLGSLPW